MSKPYTPRPYQALAQDFLVEHPRCSLWARMGMGKTPMTLTLLNTQYRYLGATAPTLILGPLRVARDVWSDEVRKWNHLAGLDVVPIIGTAAERAAALKKDAPIFTINYENLPWLREQLGDRWPFETVVADEARRLKGFRTRQGSSRAAALRDVAHTKVTQWINLTGAPAPNGLVDLWGQQWFVDRGARLGATFEAFRLRWFNTIMLEGKGQKLIPTPWAADQIHELLADCSMTLDPKDWFDLKDPVVIDVPVTLPRKARELYDQMEQEAVAEIRNVGYVRAMSPGSKSGKCLQMASGAVYTGVGEEWANLHDAKMDALDSILSEANGEPVIVVYHWRHDLYKLKKAYPAGVELSTKDGLAKFKRGEAEVGFANAACLAADTLVLTETLGWVPITAVPEKERVFDGVEFVSHAGCTYAGIKRTMPMFGVRLTPDHKVLVKDVWEEARHVGNLEARDVFYRYNGADESVRKMFEVRGRAEHDATKRGSTQPKAQNALRAVPFRKNTSVDWDSYLSDMAGDEEPSQRPSRSKLRWAWSTFVRGMEQLHSVLRRYVSDVFGRFDDRPDRRESGLLKGQLSVGNARAAASEQAKQPSFGVQGGKTASCGTVPEDRAYQNATSSETEAGPDGGAGGGRRKSVAVREDGCDIKEVRDNQNGIELSVEERHDDRTSGSLCDSEKVYDLINCGPRARFVVKSHTGDPFIVHNSIGHGVDGLQYVCNTLVYFSAWWDLDTYDQMLERVGPMRQMQAGKNVSVMVYNIVACDTMDEVVIEARSKKTTVQESLLRYTKHAKSIRRPSDTR